MASKTYIVDGRQFRTDRDYQDAMQDQKTIRELREKARRSDVRGLKDLLERGERGEFHFRTLLGEDFLDELREMIRTQERGRDRRSKDTPQKDNRDKAPVNAEKASFTRTGKPAQTTGHFAERPAGKSAAAPAGKSRERTGSESGKRALEKNALSDKVLQAAVQRELKKRERRRRLFMLASGLMAVGFLGVFGLQAYQEARTNRQNKELGQLLYSGKTGNHSRPLEEGGSVSVTLDGERETPEILTEYKAAYEKNKRLIGWLKFDDIQIGGQYGFPVMQTVDNEYYLNHDFDQNVDKNGTIFMDTNCDVLKPSVNFILYGHHMKSGAMFGRLDRYGKESYYKKYPYIEFDTIYEKGTYQVMYVFRSHVYSEDEVAFKYYQFIDALSQQEFDSYMEEMAAMSLYDTGVTARYGDQLLTLSTCDYQETNGRFVVVAKKVAFRE